MKTFYINGKIITMEDASMFAEAVCVERGRILSVGKQEELLALKEAGDEIIDLHGRTMLPAFID